MAAKHQPAAFREDGAHQARDGLLDLKRCVGLALEAGRVGTLAERKILRPSRIPGRSGSSLLTVHRP